MFRLKLRFNVIIWFMPILALYVVLWRPLYGPQEDSTSTVEYIGIREDGTKVYRDNRTGELHYVIKRMRPLPVFVPQPKK